MKEEKPKSISLEPNEGTSFVFEVPFKPKDIKIELTGKCHCGGNMIPHKKEKMTWICSRSHWWNRKKHTYLKGGYEILPTPKGSA